MANDWSVSARDELVRLREGEMAWGERSGAPPRVEPTALACLGLLAGGLGGSSKTPGDIVLRAADWLATVQLPDGALGLSATIPAPNWTTPFGILVWAALPKYAGAAQRAGQSLVQQKGAVFEDHMKIFGHDPSIVGWTWLEGEHSWLEPTALAVMALRRLGLGAEVRIRDGLKLIRDRAIPTGGWNYGNNTAFDRVLAPEATSTGLALLALAGAGKSTEVEDRAIRYLEATLPDIRTARSLCWGILGLRAWGHLPKSADRWLSETHARVSGRRDAAPRLAHLLLAAGHDSLSLFGLKGT
jgi:hypothetical protein